MDLIPEVDYKEIYDSMKNSIIDIASMEENGINDELLNYASKLCLQGTKQKNMKDICVSVSKIKNLKVTETLGEVEFKSNKRVITKKIVFT